MPKKSALELTDTRIQRAPVRRYPEFYPKDHPQAGQPHPKAGEPFMYYLWDSKVRGFGARITAQGTKTLAFKFVAPTGEQAWMPLGDYAPPAPPESKEAQKKYKSPLEVARDKATRYRAMVQDGKDPRQEKKLADEIPTVGKFAVTFLEEQKGHLKASSYDTLEAILNNLVVPVLGKLRMPDVQRSHVEDLYKKVAKGWRPEVVDTEKRKRRPPTGPTPIAANRMLANLGRMFQSAIEKEIPGMGKNPCRLGKKNKFKESKGSTRFLSGLEMHWLGVVLRDAPHWRDKDLADDHYAKKAKLPVPSPYALAAIRLYLATGARRGEILLLRWAQVDKVRGVIVIEDHKTDGTLGVKEFPINSAVAAALAEVEKLPTRGLKNEYVIQGHTLGEHMVNIQYCWNHIRKAAGLASGGAVDLSKVRIHGLRHTHASWGVMSGLSLPQVGNLLGHAHPSTTQRYSHFATDPRLEASEQAIAPITAALGF